MTSAETNQSVRSYWERQACGTDVDATGTKDSLTPEWFRSVEDHRYEVEPFIHGIAQFTRHHGKAVLEVGVGAGTDHLQWARAGTKLYGVDLTEKAIDTTRAHLGLYGFSSNLQRVDAEILPFADAFFDVVWSYGVIHHSAHPERMIREIHRVLKPGGVFLGMMYGRYSPVAFKQWVKFGPLRGNPFLSLTKAVAQHESPGTKAYTQKELQQLFSSFADCRTKQMITPYDRKYFPSWVSRFFPNECGWFIAIEAHK
jgi:ubiquinone/menaquinone biosynthesis C-methylase UbiE